jgi:hypothetical protein
MGTEYSSAKRKRNLGTKMRPSVRERGSWRWRRACARLGPGAVGDGSALSRTAYRHLVSGGGLVGHGGLDARDRFLGGVPDGEVGIMMDELVEVDDCRPR